MFEIGGHTTTVHGRDASCFGTRRATWDLLSQTRASWTGLAFFGKGSQAWQSAAACVDIAESSREHNGNRQEHAVQSVVPYHRSLESLATAIYMPRYRVRDAERVYSGSSDDMYKSIRPATLYTMPPPVLGATPVLASSWTVQDCCLVSSGQAISDRSTENVLEISVFWPSISFDNSDLARTFPGSLYKPCFVFRFQLP